MYFKKNKIIIINFLFYLFNNRLYSAICLKKYSNKNEVQGKKIAEEQDKMINNNNNNNNNNTNWNKEKKEDPLKNKKSQIIKKLKEIIELDKELEETRQLHIYDFSKYIDYFTEAELDKKKSILDEQEEKILQRIAETNEEEAIKLKKEKINKILIEVQNLIKNNFTKYFKEINITIDIDKNDIKKKENIQKLDNILKDLNDKKIEINKLIKEDDEKDKYFCKNQEEFIEKFNKRKNILAEQFNEELKNKLKSTNLESKDIDSKDNNNYFTMYQQMTNDIFNHDISLDLQIYRYILNLEGFIIAFDNIFNKDVRLHIPVIGYDENSQIGNIIGIKYDNKYYFFKNKVNDLSVIFDKKELIYEDTNEGKKTTKYEDIEFDDLGKKTRKFIEDVNKKTNFFGGQIKYETKVKEIEKKLKYINNKLGEIAVDNEKFKYLRCNGKCTNGDNCVSCKLRKLLENEKCLDLFLNIYKQQGESSDKPEAMLMKRIIYDGLKKNKKYDFYSLKINKTNFYEQYPKDEFCKEISDKFRKSVMIEWALTIEFMKRFIPKYYNGSNEFNLYRTFNKIDSVDKIKPDIYESTSLIGNFFLGINKSQLFYLEPKYLNSCNILFTKIENIKYYKCLFNYIVSPNEGTILNDDKGLEIGFIGIDEKYVKNEVENTVNGYMEYLDKSREENFDKNFGKGNWEEIELSSKKK